MSSIDTWLKEQMLPKIKESKFNQKDWNFVAKRLREAYPTHASNNMTPYKEQRRLLEELAITFAEKYEEDNSNFDPISFLDRCSPDPDIYPFSELWEPNA